MSTTDSRDVRLLVLRVGGGATLVAHGAQKSFRWFGGYGLDEPASFESVGFTPGRANAVLAGLGEAGDGALVMLGLAAPAAGAAVAGTISVATSLRQDNGFFAQNGGYEHPAVLGLAGAALALGGAGQLNLNAALSRRANRRWMRLAALASVPVATALGVGRRRAALATAAHDMSTDQSESSELPEPPTEKRTARTGEDVGVVVTSVRARSCRGTRSGRLRSPASGPR